VPDATEIAILVCMLAAARLYLWLVRDPRNDNGRRVRGDRWRPRW